MNYHLHTVDEVLDARRSINTARGKEVVSYDGSGSLSTVLRYRDTAGLTKDSLETFAYTAGGLLETVTTQIYDPEGSVVVETIVETVVYNGDGTVASEANA